MNSIYKGFAINAGFEKGGRPCTIKPAFDHIKFSCEGRDINFPVDDDLEISAGGAGSKSIYFRHSKFPDWCFYSKDKELFKNEYILKNDNAKKVISSVQSGNRLFITMIMSMLIVLFLFIAGIFIFSKYIVRGIAKNIPVEWEQKAGDAIFESIKAEKDFINDSLLNSEINNLGKLVTSTIEDTSQKFKFYLVHDTTLNAFALPGGHVVIHSGLINTSETPEEILGVLGHEIAHVTEKHHTRGLIAKAGLSVIISAFLGADSEIANLLVNAGSTLQSLKYDRDLETEADNKGLEYLRNAKIDPQGMITFFKKLEAQSNTSLGMEESLSFLSTHPATSERIKIMQERIEKDNQTYPPVKFDLVGFKEKLKKISSQN